VPVGIGFDVSVKPESLPARNGLEYHYCLEEPDDARTRGVA
jgi:hypothetical protein